MSGMPAWVIKKDGQTWGNAQPRTRLQTGRRFILSERVLNFVFEEEEQKRDKVMLTLDNHDLAYFDDPVLMKDEAFTFSFGFAGNLSLPRTARVKGISGFEQLKLEAYSDDSALVSEQRIETHVNARRSDIAQAVAARNKFARTVIKPTTKLETLQQSGITDWQFLLELAEPIGYSVFVTFEQGMEVLNFRPRPHTSTPTRRFSWYGGGGPKVPGQQVGRLVKFKIDDNTIYNKPAVIESRGYDPDNHVPVSGIAQRGATAVQPLGAVTEIAGPDAGPGKATSKQVNVSGKESLADVKADADARYTFAQDSQLKATINIEGDPTLFSQTIIELTGLPRMLAGNYLVKATKHLVGSGGYLLTAKVMRDAVSSLPVTPGNAPSTGGIPNTKKAKDAGQLTPLYSFDSQGREVIIYKRPQ
jgi:phage protein D